MTEVLCTRGLHKAFGALTATDDVSLTLRPGEIHALIGPNGAGKSTLIAQICGALRPDRGQVLLDGKDATGLSVDERARKGLARTFQVSQLAMEDSALQNVLLGAIGAARTPWHFWRPALHDDALRDRAEAALNRVGLSNHAATPCAELSHGQRRLLEIAVALTLSPRAFLMDEPMAGLGAEGTAQLVPLLKALKQDAPILLVEHDMDAVFALADRISVLVAGRIIATGSVAEIRQNPAVRAAYLGDAA